MTILPKLDQFELQNLLVEINDRVEKNHEEKLETLIDEIVKKLLVYS